MSWCPARQNAKSLEEEPTKVEKDVRRRRCCGKDQVGITPFSHPILQISSPILCVLSPTCAHSSRQQSQRPQQWEDPSLPLSSLQHTFPSSWTHDTLRAEFAETLRSFIFKLSDSIPHRAKVNGGDAASVGDRKSVV